MGYLELSNKILDQRGYNATTGSNLESRIPIETRNYNFPIREIAKACYSDGWKYCFTAQIEPVQQLLKQKQSLFPHQQIAVANGNSFQFEQEGNRTYIRDALGFKDFFLREYPGGYLLISQDDYWLVDDGTLSENAKKFELITNLVVDLTFAEFKIIPEKQINNVIWFPKTVSP